jgi:hypothetical protein
MKSGKVNASLAKQQITKEDGDTEKKKLRTAVKTTPLIDNRLESHCCTEYRVP